MHLHTVFHQSNQKSYQWENVSQNRCGLLLLILKGRTVSQNQAWNIRLTILLDTKFCITVYSLLTAFCVVHGFQELADHGMASLSTVSTSLFFKVVWLWLWRIDGIMLKMCFVLDFAASLSDTESSWVQKLLFPFLTCYLNKQKNVNQAKTNHTHNIAFTCKSSLSEKTNISVD